MGMIEFWLAKDGRKAKGRQKVKCMVAGESKRRVLKAQAQLNGAEGDVGPAKGTGSQS